MRSRFSPLHGPALVLATVLSLAAPTSEPRAESAPAPRPNILFILTDDQRFDALGTAGHPYLKTPNLDALAAEGVMFENAFVTTSLCSPSRASILTGLYGHAHGVLDNVTEMDPALPTFPSMLHDAGYETAFVGKWHMGGASDEPRPGFDHWVSFKGQGVYRDPVFNVNGVRAKEEGYVTDLITDHAVEWLERLRHADYNVHDEKRPPGRLHPPFLLYVSHKAVHAEFDAADRHCGTYANVEHPRPDTMADTDENYRGKPDWVRRQRDSWHGVDLMYNGTTDYDRFVRDYAETMLAVDDSVGRLLDKLRALGELDRTLVVFTSDNGFQFGEHGLIDKRTMYEASIRVPMIARCPALFSGGRRAREMALNVDLAPTFLEAAGVPVPESMHGRSLLPLLRAEGVPWRDAFLYEYFWERGFPQTPTVLGVRTDRYKFMQTHGVWDRLELYDLANDPDERNNLLGEYMIRGEGGTMESLVERKAPPELKSLMREMRGRLRTLLEEVGCAEEPNWRR